MLVFALAMADALTYLEKIAPGGRPPSASRELLTILENAMAFQKVTDVAEIDHIFTLNGVTVQNVHYARLPGGYTQTDLQALADAVDGVFLTTFQTEVPPEVDYIRTEVRGLAVENDLTAVASAGAGTGTHVGESLPSQVTFAIKKMSGLTGRSARGRTFWIGVAQTELQGASQNLLVAAYAALLVANVDFVRIIIAGVGLWEPVLVSRFLDKVKRSEGKTFPWTTTTNVDLRVDTHRGRLPAG